MNLLCFKKNNKIKCFIASLMLFLGFVCFSNLHLCILVQSFDVCCDFMQFLISSEYFELSFVNSRLQPSSMQLQLQYWSCNLEQFKLEQTYDYILFQRKRAFTYLARSYNLHLLNSSTLSCSHSQFLPSHSYFHSRFTIFSRRYVMISFIIRFHSKLLRFLWLSKAVSFADSTQFK